MNYGDMFDCSISVAGEQDTFTFTGTSGEKVLFRMQEVSNLSPKITVKRPDGTTLCTASNSVQVETECTLNVSGTFSLVAESPGTATGNYRLYIAVTSLPTTETATAITYGDAYSGTLDRMHWYPYTFSGTSGEKVTFRYWDVNNTLDPELRVRRPDGSQLCTDDYSGQTLALECTDDGNRCSCQLQRCHDVLGGRDGVHPRDLQGDIRRPRDPRRPRLRTQHRPAPSERIDPLLGNWGKR